MNALDILHAKIERGYRLAKDPERRPILRSAKELLEAAAATGTGVTLNAVQAAALHVWIDYHDAAQALGLRPGGEEAARRPDAERPEPPTNIVPFRRR